MEDPGSHLDGGPPLLLRSLARVSHPLLHLVVRFYRLGVKERCHRKFKRVGRGVSFDPLTSLISYESVVVGDNTHLGPYAYINGDVEIGRDVMLGPNVHMMDGYHRSDAVGLTIRAAGPDVRAKVHVEDDVWIGARASIMKGVRLGEGSIVGTGAVVLREVPPYTIAVGAPAQPVRLRFSDSQLREHLVLRGRDNSAAEGVVVRRRRLLLGMSKAHLYDDAPPPGPARLGVQ